LKRPFISRRLAPAGAVLLLLAVGAVWLFSLRKGVYQEQSASTMREIVTERGERTSVHLDDGSILMLNAESRLMLPHVFGHQVREVWLEGEAFFEVAPDGARPFRILTVSAVTEVLGTAFGITAYPEDAFMEVIVSQGIVSVRSEQAPAEHAVSVEEGQRARLQKGSHAVLVEPAAVEPLLAWKDGFIVLEHVSLRTAIPKLERWFDVKFDVADPALYGRRLTAIFYGEGLMELLEGISVSLEIRYHYDESERVITLSR
jgi:transmembrane sensor